MERRKTCLMLPRTLLIRLEDYPGDRTWKIEQLCRYAVALGALATEKLPPIKRISPAQQLEMARQKRIDLGYQFKAELEPVLSKEKVQVPLPVALLDNLKRFEGEQSEKIEKLVEFALDAGAMMSIKECQRKATDSQKKAGKLKITQPIVFRGL